LRKASLTGKALAGRNHETLARGLGYAATRDLGSRIGATILASMTADRPKVPMAWTNP
jgi:hypothetical protein